MHAAFDSTNSLFFSKQITLSVKSAMFDICSFYKDILVTSLIAMKIETHTNDPVTPSPTVYCLPGTATGNRVRHLLAQS